jgi:hypothetical protein
MEVTRMKGALALDDQQGVPDEGQNVDLELLSPHLQFYSRLRRKVLAQGCVQGVLHGIPDVRILGLAFLDL